MFGLSPVPCRTICRSGYNRRCSGGRPHPGGRAAGQGHSGRRRIAGARVFPRVVPSGLGRRRMGGCPVGGGWRWSFCASVSGVGDDGGVVVGGAPIEGDAEVRVASEVADRVEMCVFDEGEAEPRQPLERDEAGVWRGYVAGLGVRTRMPACGGRPRRRVAVDSSAAVCSSAGRRHVCVAGDDGVMAAPPIVIFGPSASTNRWWALLPSAAVLHADEVGDLLRQAEQVMTRDAPGRPFAFVLDLHGSREPGQQWHRFPLPAPRQRCPPACRGTPPTAAARGHGRVR